MLLRYPAYFDKFQCIAAQCPDSCCKDWDVAVDAATAASYLAMAGDLGDTLRRQLYQQDGEYYFSIQAGRCPFWRADGLCRIQAEQGHGALCKTCRDFPRLTHDYGDFVEMGLCMSCPEAARLILTEPAAPWVTAELPGGEPPEYDRQDMACLLRTRDIMSTILADESHSVPEALALGLLYAYEAQAQLDGEAPAEFDPTAALEAAKSLAKPADPRDLTDFYLGLELLTDRWQQHLQAPAAAAAWDPALRAVARYGVERYWLQAISDFDLVGRAKMVISGCVLLHFLGGELLQTAQLYAKEIENDPDNVDAILDGAYTSPALTDDKLLGWLLL